MLRSMYSGISGMKNFQTKLDVIGNNIANVNTFGFKKSRVTFKDAMYQTMSSAAAPAGNLGGMNAKQVGLGSEVGTIEAIHTESSMQTTGRILDLAIAGDGYFIVSDGTNDYYTRAGNFYLDEDGALVTADGLKVQAYNTATPSVVDDVTIDLNTTYSDFTIGPTGVISGVRKDTGAIETIGTIALATFSNTTGLESVGGNRYTDSLNSGAPNIDVPGDARGTIATGKLEMSNVDLSEEFTEMIVAQRAFQANTRIITTSDEILQELVNLKR